MGFEEAKRKLELINLEIECANNVYQESKKMDKRMIALGTVSLIVIGFTSGLDNKMSALDVISLSLLVTSLHNCIRSFIDSRLDYQHNIQKLEIDKKHYERIVNDSKSNVELEIIQCEQ